MKFSLLCASLGLVATMTVHPAHAQDFLAAPHSSSLHFVQYGVALTAESLASSGSVCPKSANSPCILGPGLGLVLRMGYRNHGPFYFGAAYEATRHESSNILRLGVLQQLRAETRYLFGRGNRLSPYALLGGGAALYGNEWRAETGGPAVHLGAGFEYQASASAVVGLGCTWRGIAFLNWVDDTGQRRANSVLGFGLSQWIALEIILEIRNPLPRW